MSFGRFRPEQAATLDDRVGDRPHAAPARVEARSSAGWEAWGQEPTPQRGLHDHELLVCAVAHDRPPSHARSVAIVVGVLAPE
jgi:hypothetical protein